MASVCGSLKIMTHKAHTVCETFSVINYPTQLHRVSFEKFVNPTKNIITLFNIYG